MITIVIIDKQEADRNRTHAILSSQNDFAVLAQGKDGYDALKKIERFKPDIAILDICLDIINGPEIIPLLRCKSPETAVLFLTSLEDEEHICKILRHDVRGYLLKDRDMDALPAAVRLVHKGGRFISSKINDKVYHILTRLLKNQEGPQEFRRQSAKTVHDDITIPNGISRRELKVMTYVCQGYSTKEIAENLSLTAGTVRNYLSAAMQKAGLQHRTQVPLFIMRNGLLPLGGKKKKPAIMKNPVPISEVLNQIFRSKDPPVFQG